MMRFGVGIPTARDGLFYPAGFSTPESMLAITRSAEELGFYSAWGNDHITTQRYVKARGEHPNFYDPLIVFSYLLPLTSRIRLGSAVVVAPLRNPVLLAKQAITLDHLAKGRFILGIGLGAYREEFEALGGRGVRGHILDEVLQSLQLLLYQEPPATYEGKYIKFYGVEMLPKPVSRPFPLFIGGNSRQVVERVARYAQGWIPACLPPEELAHEMGELSARAREHGRDPSTIELAPEAICSINRDRQQARKSFLLSHMFQHLLSLRNATLKNIKSFSEEEIIKRNFVGTPSDIIKKLEQYRDIGLEHIWFDFVGSNLGEVLEQMKLFSLEVMPSFG
jgi:probable F420-dependent oxidoreductase